MRKILVITLIGFVAMAQEVKPPAQEWSYNGQQGPRRWGDISPEYATCKLGQLQSPIDIRNARKAPLPAMTFEYKPSALRIVNNGHTIQVNYDPGSFIAIGDKRYELRQFHFHHPSEERIEGKGYEMVAHLAQVRH